MTSSRRWSAPPEENTVHLIGDLQDGLTYSAGQNDVQFATSMRKGRRDKIAMDWRYGDLPSPTGGHLTVGDLIHRGHASEDADVQDFLANLTANTGQPWYKTMGNHDIYDNARTPAQWASAWGLSSPNQVIDLPFVRLIILGIEPLRPPSGSTVIDQGKCYVSVATINWLNAQLQATHKDCWIVCHAPLRYTIQDTDTTGWLRTDDDNLFNQVLATNANAKAWISGHTHTSLQSITTDATGGSNGAGVWMTKTLNGRNMAHINAGCLANASRVEEIGDDTLDWSTEWWEPMLTFWITYVDEDRYELRVRDHGAGLWIPRDGNPANKIETVQL